MALRKSLDCAQLLPANCSRALSSSMRTDDSESEGSASEPCQDEVNVSPGTHWIVSAESPKLQNESGISQQSFSKYKCTNCIPKFQTRTQEILLQQHIAHGLNVKNLTV